MVDPRPRLGGVRRLAGLDTAPTIRDTDFRASRAGSRGGGRGTAELAQPLAARREQGAHKLRREVGPVGLVFASVGSIIGAGWLFGALYASSLAGPAALIAWVLGGGRDDAARPYPCRARRRVSRGRRQCEVSALRIRQADRLHGRVGRLPRRGDRRADHGRGGAAVHVELHPLADDGLGRRGRC